MHRTTLLGLGFSFATAIAVSSCVTEDPPTRPGASATGGAAAEAASTGGEAAESTPSAPTPRPQYRALRGAGAAFDPAATDGLDPAARASVDDWLSRDRQAYLVVDDRSGRLVHATGRLSEPSGEEPSAIWRAFVSTHSELLHLDRGATELRPEQAPTRLDGSRVYRLRQLHDGVPVMRRSLKLEIAADGSVRTLSGVTDSDVGVVAFSSPRIDGPTARTRAEQVLRARTHSGELMRETVPALMLWPGHPQRPSATTEPTISGATTPTSW